MKLIFATDLHGDTAAYAALADLARAEQATAVLLGGDLCEYSRTAAPQLAYAAGPLRQFFEELRAARIGAVAIWGNDDRAALAARLQDFARAGLLTLAGTTPQWVSAAATPGERVAVVGYPYVPPTPFRIKEQERRDLAADRYQGRLPSSSRRRRPMPRPWKRRTTIWTACRVLKTSWPRCRRSRRPGSPSCIPHPGRCST